MNRHKGGTIFLDEIGDMTINTQVKLLRVLQERTIQRVGGHDLIPVDMRVIAATHRNLEEAIREHKFREDLYYRLNVATIHLPALRHRTEDIKDLIKHFIQRFIAELGLVGASISPNAIAFLDQQPWPGNVRELENVVCKSLLLARGQIITLDIIHHAFNKPASQPTPIAGHTIPQYVADLLHRAVRGELENIESALSWDVGYELYKQAIQLAQGNQAKAAKWLGVSRPTMREKLALYGLRPETFQNPY